MGSLMSLGWEQIADLWRNEIEAWRAGDGKIP
jgi:hypothetical protein